MSSENNDNDLNISMVNVQSLSTNTRFKFIKEIYGYDTYKLYQMYEKTSIKLVRLYSDLNYLYECRSNNVIPKFLRFSLANPELANTRCYWKCQTLLLKEEINSKKYKIKYMSGVLENLYNELFNIFPDFILHKINDIVSELQSKEDKVKYRTHRRKFNKLIGYRLIEQQQQVDRDRLLNDHPMNQVITNNTDNGITIAQPNQVIKDNTNNNDNTTAQPNQVINNNTNNNDNTAAQPKLVWNLSNRRLTEDELHLLENGLSYNRLRKIDRSEVISNVEYLFYQASGIKKEETDFKKWDQDPDSHSDKEIRTLEPRQLSFAADLKSATTKFFNEAQGLIRRKKNFNQWYEDELLSNLSKDTAIVITKPDKGRGVVIMNRADYVRKLEQILSDGTKFELLDKDPTGSRETALTNLLRAIQNDNYLTKQEYWYIKPVGSIPARLYGLPKVHKKNTPLRPIVSCIQSYNYRLGKFLAGIIKPIRNSTYSLKNTDSFIKFLKENSSLSIHKMISFDVESLFTNIPVDRTIDIICYKLYDTDPKLNPVIPQNYFRKLLEYATKRNHFLFNGKYYDQCDGVSMGTSLAAIFAEVFMANFEEQHISRLLTNGSKLLVWRRYVDDTFIIYNDDVDNGGINKKDLHLLLNTFDSCIKFTVEPGVDNPIPFLDVLVKRHSTGFETTVYRKPTTTKLMLKWDSLIPTSYKRASVYALVNRAIRICSTFDLLHNEFIYIRSMADFNGYPSNFVQNIINKQLDKFYQPRPPANLFPPPPSNTINSYKYIQIPFIGTPSYKYGKTLKSIVQQLNPMTNIRVIYTTINETRRYFPTKDKLKPAQKSGVVYQISCNDCDSTYIGKTIRQAFRRYNEHEKDVVKASLVFMKRSSLVKEKKRTTQNTNRAHGRIQKIVSTQQVRKSARILNQQLKHQSQQHLDPLDVSYYKPNSALGKHAFKTRHSIQFTDVKILKQEHVPYKLQIKESIEIRSKQPKLNGTDTSVPLYVFPEGHLSLSTNQQ
ncbi:unnamed protein product [Adineta steineri]|uniref:Reverse transcriptase domain-containing protein n=2 Tax=Adineta steineri TaxID=433720 RepID=A0A819SP42_9BILA|nr:unnamed protein product [Adineta steineri]